VPIDVTSTYPAPPDAVLAVLTDEQFLRDRAAALGARVEEVVVARDGAGPRTSVRLSTATAGIPPLFARFVGASVSVLERSAWALDGTGHRADIEVSAEVFGRAVRVSGERRLTAAAEGARSTVTGDARVDAPIVGRQAEAAVRELVAVVLRREDEVLRRRLG
jgi:uncharacterized protein DUF2505